MEQEWDGEPTRTAHNAIEDDRILDAAYDLFLAIGSRRMSMADVARHADVSRATLYRRWPNVRSLVGSLFNREWRTLSVTSVVVDPEHGRDRVVRSVVHFVKVARTHPVMRKTADSDPEYLLPYLLERKGAAVTHLVDVVEQGILLGIADGSIRAGNAHDMADVIVLTCRSFVTSGSFSTESLDAIDDELAIMLDRYLAPTFITMG